MHGHPFPGPLQLWWGKSNPPERPRNLFSSLQVGEMPASDRFRAGGSNGHIGGNGRVRRTALHQLMAKLTKRVRLSRAEPGDSNSGIPAGYTYLLQFIAHDMVDSVLSFNLHDSDIIPGARNARSEPLRLETLYGNGPDECPHAYEYTRHQQTQGLIPRIRLRLGERAHEPLPAGNPYCPFRDIARNTAQKSRDGSDADTLLTEAMLADPRNDAHALISQITVLFQLLHNHVISLLEAAIAPFAELERIPKAGTGLSPVPMRAAGADPHLSQHHKKGCPQKNFGPEHLPTLHDGPHAAARQSQGYSIGVHLRRLSLRTCDRTRHI